MPSASRCRVVFVGGTHFGVDLTENQRGTTYLSVSPMWAHGVVRALLGSSESNSPLLPVDSWDEGDPFLVHFRRKLPWHCSFGQGSLNFL